jgi:hypothetical protein
VLDPFAGSCVTGEVCERLEREWVCIELSEDYLKGGLVRFEEPKESSPASRQSGGASEGGLEYGVGAKKQAGKSRRYELWRAGALWGVLPEAPLAPDGGKTRTTDGGELLAKSPPVARPPESLPTAESFDISLPAQMPLLEDKHQFKTEE